jgi:hypothetical protein
MDVGCSLATHASVAMASAEDSTNQCPDGEEGEALMNKQLEEAIVAAEQRQKILALAEDVARRQVTRYSQLAADAWNRMELARNQGREVGELLAALRKHAGGGA